MNIEQGILNFEVKNFPQQRLVSFTSKFDILCSIFNIHLFRSSLTTASLRPVSLASLLNFLSQSALLFCQFQDFIDGAGRIGCVSVGPDFVGVILGDWCADYSTDFARRAMADLAFTDSDGFYYIVDVKTHRTSTKFNMPNLTSVRRLARFYEDDRNFFVLLLVSYHLVESRIVFTDVKFTPIEFMDWECLTIGALGWGQIQIANSNKINVVPRARKQWMLELCDILTEFYEREIGKIGDRIGYFDQVRDFWLTKPDD